jgi:hypothetical protein
MGDEWSNGMLEYWIYGVNAYSITPSFHHFERLTLGRSKHVKCSSLFFGEG